MRSIKLTNLFPLGGLCKACITVGIPCLYYRRWNNLIQKLDDINDSNKFVPYNTKGPSRPVHTGGKSVLPEIKSELKTFIFKI